MIDSLTDWSLNRWGG